MKPVNRRSGFALILTLSLLALLVLALLAMSALVQVHGQVATAGAYQTQARQNALLGLRVGLGDLQRHAGDDSRITGMAGITGIGASAGNNTRHWCGVWRNDNGGTFVTWLVSGAPASAGAALPAGTTSVELASNGSVGAAAANSEHVIAGKIPIVVPEVPGSPGVATTIGHYAYLVIDEGVKSPAYSPDAATPVAPVIFSASASSAQGKLRDAIATHTTDLPKVLIYEQLSLLPTPALTPSVLQDNFHHVTLTSRFVNGAQLAAGSINVNTNSAIVWRNILQTYNTSPGAPAQIASAILSTRGTTIQNSIAAYAAGQKSASGPFRSAADVAGFMATVFTSGSPTASQIMTVITPMLAVRSDTFRIRGYGEALNPSDATRLEAAAQCEAIVQRTTSLAPNGLGNKFVILYFRWLGPGDL